MLRIDIAKYVMNCVPCLAFCPLFANKLTFRLFRKCMMSNILSDIVRRCPEVSHPYKTVSPNFQILQRKQSRL